MGNKLSVDKTPSSIENIISFPLSSFPPLPSIPDDNQYQHLSLWSFSESQMPSQSTSELPTNQITSTAIDLTNIHKTHFLLNSNEVYIILLVFKKEKEHIIEQSPFPTGLWGIIESSSNMTPRGLLYAFPATNNDSQNLESFLLSKRDFSDSEFKYMLFIWNGKSSSALLRSYTLMKAFDLDKALSSQLVPFIYYGYNIGKESVVKSETVKLNEIINNTIENSEDSRPSSEKISNYHETVYLLKWLYPIGENKNKEKKVKKEKICFKGFNRNFITTANKKNFYNNFKPIEIFENKKDYSKSHINVKEEKEGKKTIVMPPKLNLNLSLKKDKTPPSSSLNSNNDNIENIDSNSSNPLTSKSKEKKDEEEYSFNDDTDTDLNLNTVEPSHIALPNNIPKLTVSLQHNMLNEELISKRSKKKAEEEDSLNDIPESTLIQTSEKILNSGDEIDINALNENYSLKDSERKKIISDYYSKHLSEIIPDFLYLSSYNAAKNKDLLEKNGITHIINCAADFCANVYENEYKYLSFFLKDHVMENIECVFYESIQYIEKAKESGGKVLVQCIQGISRSVSIIIAYLIYKNKMTYDKAFELVQSKRTIASPNFGFAIQLQNFYMRLYEPPEKYRYIPKIFAVGNFQLEQVGKIVCRLMNEPFFENRDNGLPRLFDKRGVFIVVSLKNIYIWLGKNISPTMKQLYIDAANKYIPLLQQYEHAPQTIITVNDGETNEDFINDLLNTEERKMKYRNHLSDEFCEWNNWYKEKPLKKEDKKTEGTSSSINLPSEETKKAFFLYPTNLPDFVLDFDDLNDNQYLIATVNKGDKKLLYKWKGNSNTLTDEECVTYMNKVIEEFFKQKDTTGIDIIDEVPMEESDEFLNLL